MKVQRFKSEKRRLVKYKSRIAVVWNWKWVQTMWRPIIIILVNSARVSSRSTRTSRIANMWLPRFTKWLIRTSSTKQRIKRASQAALRWRRSMVSILRGCSWQTPCQVCRWHWVQSLIMPKQRTSRATCWQLRSLELSTGRRRNSEKRVLIMRKICHFQSWIRVMTILIQEARPTPRFKLRRWRMFRTARSEDKRANNLKTIWKSTLGKSKMENWAMISQPVTTTGQQIEKLTWYLRSPKLIMNAQE